MTMRAMRAVTVLALTMGACAEDVQQWDGEYRATWTCVSASCPTPMVELGCARITDARIQMHLVPNGIHVDATGTREGDFMTLTDVPLVYESTTLATFNVEQLRTNGGHANVRVWPADMPGSHDWTVSLTGPEQLDGFGDDCLHTIWPP